MKVMIFRHFERKTRHLPEIIQKTIFSFLKQNSLRWNVQGSHACSERFAPSLTGGHVRWQNNTITLLSGIEFPCKRLCCSCLVTWTPSRFTRLYLSLFKSFGLSIYISSGIFLSVNFQSVFQNCSYVCEGERTWLQCKQYEMLKLNRVFWGREDNQICPNAPLGLTVDKPCETDPEQAMKKVNGQCRNQQACEIVASNVFFDEPSCKNTYKYLKLCYECVPDSANAVDVLTEAGKRKKRGTKLESLISKMRAKEEKRIMDELWRHPFRGKTF